MAKFLVDKGTEDPEILIEEYRSSLTKMSKIEFQFCTRNASCLECELFNICITAGLAPNGIRK